MERTFVMIKPDGIRRGLVGDIISRIEKKGFLISEARLFCPSRDKVETHYDEHKTKPFYGELVDFISGGKVMAMVVEGEHTIELMRLMIGDKDPLCALPGTIRGDYAYEKTQNLIHASDSRESATREIEIWF